MRRAPRSGAGAMAWPLAVPLAACLALLPAAGATFSPVVGVLAMPEFKPHPSQAKRSYIAASYVKWLEASGAHVVPLVYDAPHSDTVMLLEKVNGIIFPGGLWDPGSEYEAFSRRVFDTGVKERIPMWGECLGLLQFLLFTSGLQAPGPVTSGWDALGPPPMLVNLNMTEAGKNWAPLAGMEQKLQQGIQTKPWVWHSHGFSVDLSAYEQNSRLTGFWDLLAVAKDRKGAAFVDIVQAKTLPIFGLMWHPEKNAYEFMPERIGIYNSTHDMPMRSTDATAAMGSLSRFFVDRCRKFRSLRFTQKDLATWNIHNWAFDHTGPRRSVFEEMIWFPASNAPRAPPIAGQGLPLHGWHTAEGNGTAKASLEQGNNNLRAIKRSSF